MHRKWFNANYKSSTGNDIDDILLNADPLGHIILNTALADIGTPERLRDLRGTLS